MLTPMIDTLESRRLFASTPTFTVTFDDPGQAFEDYHVDVRSTLLAAANDWAAYIDSAAKIDLLVDFDSSLRSPTLATAGFDRRVFFRDAGPYDIELGNVAAELRTGRDQNGSEYDAFISIRPGALDEFFYDATANRTVNLPETLIDARTVLLHELGHTLGFFGDGDGPGDSPAGDRFVYDQYVTYDDSTGDIYFNGPNAVSVYGGKVPLTFEDSSHLGNDFGPGEDIADDLMAPTIPDGARRFISDLDRAILADAGVPMKNTNIPSIRTTDVTVTRTGTPGQKVDFVLTLTKASAATVSVPVQTINGTALAGRDYQFLSRTVKFNPGETSKTISVPLLAGSVFDPTKTFFLNLGLPTGAALLQGDAMATIKNGVIAADNRHTATFKGTGGNVVTISLLGPGTAVVNRDPAGNLNTITVTGSNGNTELFIRGKKPTTLFGLTAKGGLGALDAPTTNFSGNLKLVGTNDVVLRDVQPGSTLTFGAARLPLLFVARNVTNSTIKATGQVFKLTANKFRNSTLLAKGSVETISLGSAISSNIFIGTETFPTTKSEFTNKKAVLKIFTIREGGLFSDTRLAAPIINDAILGIINTDNADTPFGLSADRILIVSGSTPLDPTLERTNLRTPGQSLTEDDFQLRIL